MSDIEKRARELLAELARNFGQPEYAYHIGCGGFLDAADRKVIAPIIAALTPPEGFVLVPVEPTAEMLQAAAFGVAGKSGQKFKPMMSAGYAAMLAARPEVQP